MNIKKLISELKRRNVIKVAAAYAIASWLIAQIANVLEDALRLPDWFDTVTVSALLLGFPVAMIFAWAFELTPDGLKKTDDVDKETSITPKTGKKINGIIIGVLSLALVFLLVERIFFAEASFAENQTDVTIETASIAVLPFQNMSSDEENEYFSDGLSEELLNVLAKVDGIKVAGRTSSFQFKGQNPDLRDVGEQLGVKHVLEGSVRKSGNRVRITAQLINADDGYHIWSETYDRELNDIFLIQDEISRAVLNELKVYLLPEAEKNFTASSMPTTDVEAYNVYLKATQLEASRLDEDLRFAIQLYDEAIKIDPSFAKAYARKAIAYELLSSYGNVKDEDRRRNVQENVDQALFINEEIPEAYAALGLMYNSNGEIENSIKAYKKALELNPNYGIAYSWIGNAYSYSDSEKAIENYRKAFELDPLNSVVTSNYARSLMFEDKYEEALEIYEARQKLDPKFMFSYYRIAEIKAFSMGEISAGFESLLKANEIDENANNTLFWLSVLASNTGFVAYADELNKKIQELYPDNIAVRGNQFWIDYYNRDSEALLNYIENSYMFNEGKEEFSALYIYATYNIADLVGRQDLIDKIIAKYYPEFIEGDLELSQDNFSFADIWVKRLKDKEENEQLKMFADAICEFAVQERKKLNENPSSNDHIYPELLCADLNGDRAAFLKAWKEYNETMSPLQHYYDLVDSDNAWGFVEKGLPEIEATRQRAIDHYKDEYAKSIEVMKNYGVWDNSWPTEPKIGGKDSR